METLEKLSAGAEGRSGEVQEQAEELRVRLAALNQKKEAAEKRVAELETKVRETTEQRELFQARAEDAERKLRALNIR